MRHITEGVYGLVMSRGIANAKSVGAGKVRGMKGPGAASDGALGGVAADAREGGQERPPIGRLGGARQPMGMEPGKGRGPLEPAPVQQGGRQHRGDLKPLCKIQNNLNVGEPSPANGRPVLRLLQGGSSKRSATTNVTLRLVLT
jgi:hypothetical protein